MKRLEIVLCLILLLSLTVNTFSQSGDMQGKGVRILDPDTKEYQTVKAYENSYAVCIGIDEYIHWPMLSCAVSDAVAMQKKLMERGFNEVKLIKNEEATKQGILSALAWLARTAHEDDRVVIYFSGHGETREGRGGEKLGYIIPVDCTKTDYYVNAISMGKISEVTYEIKAKHILYLMDCCYSGIALMAPRADEEFMIQMTQDPCVYMITAGKAGEQALEIGDHGLFTGYILRGLNGEADGDKNGVVSGTELGQYTRRWVMFEANKLNRTQTPRFGAIDGEGEIVFLTPSKATLVVDVSPKGYVSLDGGDRNPAPMRFSSISAGQHTITASAPDFQTRIIDVMINSGEEKHVPVTLERMKVKLGISSDPAGAAVTLDGEPRGKTPLQLDSIPTGDHKLSMTLPDYEPVEQLITVHSLAQPISVVFTRSQGSIQITSSPGDAEIYIDGKRQNQTTPAALRLPVGKHKLELRKSLYRSVSRDIQVERGANQSINLSLEAQAQLRITSEPPGSMVDLGELGIHQTPALIPGVKAGDYEATATLKGYRKETKSFRIVHGMSNTLEIRLFPISRTRMALYSLIVPGSGQYYGGRYGSGTAFLIAGLGSAVGAAVGYIQYNQSVDSYDDSVALYDKALSLEEIQSAKRKMRDAHDDADSKFMLRQGMFVAVGAVWAANAIHAYIAGPATATSSTQEHVSLPDWNILPRLTPDTAAVMLLQSF